MTIDLPSLHPACLSPEVLLKDCDTQRKRASGPGGQHRNKVETAIILTHEPTGLTGAASERRSQAQNQAMALKRLRVQLAIHHRCGVALSCDEHGRLQGEMSERWYGRVRSQKLQLNSEHEDFPAILAWVMDMLWQLKLDVPAAANLLGVSATQILKLLKAEPEAMAIFNKARDANGQHRMK